MLKRLAMSAVAAVLAVGGVGHVAANGTSSNTLLSEGVSLELGERDFINYCAACHGVGAKGDGTIGEFLTLSDRRPGRGEGAWHARHAGVGRLVRCRGRRTRHRPESPRNDRQ